LASETSPYLRQHAENPVEWYPWGPEAFERARAEGKPVFVSIGYASCHWCHVMAHESFEDEATARDLARSFVSVKVDREERPDVDAVYMGAVLALTGSGGWPMSVFCTPDARPFFAGTYFPPVERHGMPSFRAVLAAMADAWDNRRGEVDRQAAALVGAVTDEVRLLDDLALQARAGGTAVAAPASPAVLGQAVAELAERFDPRWGGFGGAPKFPRPTLVELCLRQHRRTGEPHPLVMATTTLDAMAAGGMYDHLVGGFCRYSTDDRWLVPHFEKMLTDQALLARAYLHSWQLTGNPDHRQVAAETIDYVLRELPAPGGGLFSSEDADAAGIEGGHATFTPAQVRDVMAAAGRSDLTEAVLDWYGITEGGNWEGVSVLHRPPGAGLSRPPEIEEARDLLAAARRGRPAPAVDDKVLTEWNAMFAATLAEAAAATGDPDWAARAEEIVTFLFAELRRPGDGRWLRSWQGGRARHLAMAADLAWVVDACTRLGELTGRAGWTERAAQTADALLDGFWDGGDGGTGGVFTTGHDAEALIVRAKEVVDGAVPSANSAAAVALLRLGAVTGVDRYRAAGERIVELAAPFLSSRTTAVADLVAAAALADDGAEVVIAGDRPDLLAAVRRHWLPSTVLTWGDRTPSPLWEGRVDGLAYVCRHFTCRLPTGDPVELAGQLDELDGGGGPPAGPSGA
jgi:uncharacterized protein YyaL (SSP411 family)